MNMIAKRLGGIFGAFILLGGCVPDPITMEIDQLVVTYDTSDNDGHADMWTNAYIKTQGLPPGLEDVISEVTVNDVDSYDEYCYSDNYGNLLCSASMIYYGACGTAVYYTIVIEYDGVDYEMSQTVTPEGLCQ